MTGRAVHSPVPIRLPDWPWDRGGEAGSSVTDPKESPNQTLHPTAARPLSGPRQRKFRRPIR